MPKLQLSGMFQQQQQPPPDLLTAQLLLSTKKQSPTTSFVDKIVSKVTTGVLPMLARMSGQGGSSSNSSALTSVVNSRHASVQSSAANSARMNEPSSNAASAQTSSHDSIMISEILSKQSYNGGTVTPDESSPPKPRSGMVSRASLTQLSSLSSQASQPHVVAGGVGGGSTAPTPYSSTTQSVFMSKSKSRSRFDQAHANGHNPSQSPFVTTDDGQTPPPTSATSSSSPGSPTIVVRASFPNMTMTPRSKKEGGGGMSLPPIMSARSTISAVPSNPSIASST